MRDIAAHVQSCMSQGMWVPRHVDYAAAGAPTE